MSRDGAHREAVRGDTAEELDRGRPPAAGPPRPFSFPAFERRRIPGGPEILLAPWKDLPMVCLEVIAPAGAERDPVGEAGLARLTGELLDEGTGSSSAEEIARAADRMGSSLVTGAGWHTGYLSLQILRPHLEPALELLADVLTSARFPPAEVERLRREQEVELIKRRDRPALLALDALKRLLYGEGVYGTPLAGTEASVRRLDRERVETFYRSHYRIPTTTLVAVGDVDGDHLGPLVERSLVSDEESRVPPLPEIVPLPRERLTIHLVDRPAAAQTELRMGHVGPARLDPDFLAFIVLNVLLGGKFTSRINLSLRERHGYTYGASSRLSIRRGPAPFVVSAAVATESVGAAVREVLSELERLRQEPVSSQELEDSRNYLAGVFPYTLQTLEGVVQRLENLVIFGLPDDYYDRYHERLQAVDREKLLQTARRHLHPKRIAVVAAGPVDRLRPQLESLDLGPVEVLQ